MKREGILQEQGMLNIRWPEDKVGTLFMLYTGIPKIVTVANVWGWHSFEGGAASSPVETANYTQTNPSDALEVTSQIL